MNKPSLVLTLINLTKSLSVYTLNGGFTVYDVKAEAWLPVSLSDKKDAINYALKAMGEIPMR